MLTIESTIDSAGPFDVAVDQPFLEIEGVEGSALRASLTAVTLIRSVASGDVRHVWPYARLGGIRLDAYGPIGVIRATVKGTATDLPLLLLEPDQIAAARRGLEMVWNVMDAEAGRMTTA